MLIVNCQPIIFEHKELEVCGSWTFSLDYNVAWQGPVFLVRAVGMRLLTAVLTCHIKLCSTRLKKNQ